ncbi:unnamed protein product, partial [Ectocarpus sp. 13 AM-2016]
RDTSTTRCILISPLVGYPPGGIELPGWKYVSRFAIPQFSPTDLLTADSHNNFHGTGSNGSGHERTTGKKINKRRRHGNTTTTTEARAYIEVEDTRHALFNAYFRPALGAKAETQGRHNTRQTPRSFFT